MSADYATRLARWQAARERRSLAGTVSASRDTLAEMRMSADGDEWGNAMSHAFGLCDALTVHGRGDIIPAEMQYRPSPILSTASVEETWPDSEYLDALDDGTLTPEAAERALRLLHRYLEILRRLGRDY